MTNNYDKNNGFEKPLSTLTGKERLELTEEYENARFDVTFHIELLMEKLAKKLKKPKLKRRKEKHGEQINDIGAY